MILPGVAYTQPLRDINYKYLYNPNESFHFTLKAEHTAAGWSAYYRLELRDTSLNVDDFVIQWDIRNSLGDKEGTPVTVESITKNTSQRNTLSGEFPIQSSQAAQILAAKVVNNVIKRAWMFYKILTPEYPVDGHLVRKQEPILSPYLKSTVATIKSGRSASVVSYYSDDFPAASPAFSETVGRVSKGMTVDSTFTVTDGQEVNFQHNGLYLVQRDTNATQGFAFRVENDYPKFSRLESLADPLIYVCTKQEFERIKLAKGDKKAFDRVILNVTGNAERARDFMRSYFRRVELANLYFTSYKEGWKTDRGMIYIIFGMPDEVFRSADREIWSYKNEQFKANFEFIKSGTLFDPDNFVLIREKKYQQTWYEVIDLWRNARF
jgi:GWxTD domain-containing protein